MNSISAPPAALVAEAIARIEARRDTLDLLADKGMAMVERLVAGEMVEIPGRKRFADPARAFAVISRAVRLCLALASRLDQELIALLRGGPIPDLAILAPEPAVETPAAASGPRERIARAVDAAIEADSGDREAAERHRSWVQEHLIEGEDYDALLHQPWRAVVQAICTDLGLRPDWSVWTTRRGSRPQRRLDWAYHHPTLTSSRVTRTTDLILGDLRCGTRPRSYRRGPARSRISPRSRENRFTAARAPVYTPPMRQTFDETTDPSFGEKHAPLIRAAMARQGLDGFLIPHEDEHQNEYLPAANDRLAWATGFTGSAGAAVILKDKAAVFVDGRYTVQVREQVDPKLFEIRDLVDGGVPAYLREAAKPGWKIGYDARLHSPDALHWLNAAASSAGATLTPVEDNPLDAAWGAQRPAQPQAPVSPHPLDYAGETSTSKRARVGADLAKAGAEAAVITAPASIAWLFNVRGGDVIRSPLPLAQAILDADGTARLFLDPAKVTADLPAWLGNEVRLETPADLAPALASLKGRKVLIDPAQSSAWYVTALQEAGAEVVRTADPCALPRACKNDVEIAGTKAAHVRDGAALTRFLHWLATEGQSNPPDEKSAVAKLESFREETGLLRDLSFDTIAGAGPNGAMPHYHPSERTNRRVASGSLLLVDSGGQYLDGTTDVTRTVAIGEPTSEMRQRFTLVLKGHLALASVRFPVGTTGSALDALARLPMWMAGLDYDHGTGHGVGVYLGVHEGPHRIAKQPNTVALQAGMIVSNEPGYYKEGDYGIRIENLQFVTPAAPIPGGERPMLGFEALTLAPIDRRLIDRDLLGADERTQLDAYHARVLREIGPLVPDGVKAWLMEACRPI